MMTQEEYIESLRQQNKKIYFMEEKMDQYASEIVSDTKQFAGILAVTIYFKGGIDHVKSFKSSIY